jgi:hypothetical protein
MDRDVTVRFYRLEPIPPGGQSADAALREIDAFPMNERHLDVGNGVILRLEELQNIDGLLVGDFTRVQIENLPSHVTANRLEPLPVDHIGHSAAFCLNPATMVMALQFDMKMRIGRTCTYLSGFRNFTRIGYMPVLEEGALETFLDQTPKKFSVKIARVNQFSESGWHSDDFDRTLEHLGAMFGAPTIEIKVSTKGRDSNLDKSSVKTRIKRFLRLREEDSGVVVKSITGETHESEDAFNFITQLLKSTRTLELPSNDPEATRRIRMDFVRECYNENRQYLDRAYAQ